eukprot:Rhum_TRINITY_DN14409_c16_g1::Rhum_TRINITY_DN14409_c16_g1_i1::g.88440::m.88440
MDSLAAFVDDGESSSDEASDASSSQLLTSPMRRMSTYMAVDFKDGRKVLWRGLHNLPPKVMEAHRDLQKGWSYAWLAPSSTSENKRASVDFLKTTDPKTNILFKVWGATEGLPLHKVSQFPDEAEVLLPPFSTFRVDDEPEQLEGYLLITLRFQGSLLRADSTTGADSEMIEFINDVREDVQRAAQRRRNFEATQQVQGVEECARTYTTMERDLLVERLKSLHAQYTLRIRINDVKHRRNTLLRLISRRRDDIEKKHKTLEELRDNGQLRYNPVLEGRADLVSNFRGILLALKEDCAVQLAADEPLIARLGAAFSLERRSPQVAVKEAYASVRDLVLGQAGPRAHGEPWPAHAYRLLTPQAQGAVRRHVKTLVIAAEFCTRDDLSRAVAAMDPPLDNLLVLHAQVTAYAAERAEGRGHPRLQLASEAPVPSSSSTLLRGGGGGGSPLSPLSPTSPRVRRGRSSTMVAPPPFLTQPAPLTVEVSGGGGAESSGGGGGGG